MISMETIKSNWAAITPSMGSSISRRADAAHPLDFFIGYDESCRMQFILLSDELPVLPESSKQIEVRGNLRADGKYAICFSLISNSLRDLFITVCWDIMDSTCCMGSDEKGISSALTRFGKWQAMLSKSKETGMTDLTAKGLFGELTFLADQCIPRYGAAAAVNGWLGPLYADRDFEYDDTWFEVKSIAPEKDAIQISSFDQLDMEATGNLVVYFVEKAASEVPVSVSLEQLVNRIVEMLSCSNYAQTVFITRLLLSGYKKDDEKIKDSFIVHKREIFLVNADFPRIRASSISQAICGGQYSLKIAALEQWRLIE